MNTINKEIKISGITLMEGKVCDVTIRPSKYKGIFFKVGDNEQIVATVENVISTQNFVTIGTPQNHVKLVEHFMAACAICNIDSIEVSLSSNELPILDGSAKVWVEELRNVGFSQQIYDEIIFSNSLNYQNGDTSIVLFPSDEFKITYLFDFNHPQLKSKWCSITAKTIEDVIEARTFGFVKDLEKFQKMGIAMGASIDNTVGLLDEGYTVDLRSELEPVKHKILDIIGDLRLTGSNPLKFKAHVIAKQAGHASHVEFAKIIKHSI